MKKLILLMTAFFLISGVSYAEFGKGKKKKCAKGKTCCAKKADDKSATAEAGEKKSCGDKSATKACCKSKSKTAEM